MISIRRATGNEAALIADISRETFYDTFAEHNTKADMEKFLSLQFSKEQLIAEVNDPTHFFFLAYDKTLPAGYIFIKPGSHSSFGPNEQLEISRLYVRKEFIGRGIGRTLIQAAIKHSIQQKMPWLWLGVWEHNQRAIRFYRDFGFEKFGEHDFLLGDDVQQDWLMSVSLANLM